MTTDSTPAAPREITSANAAFAFYDIESLHNAFTLCLYSEKSSQLMVFHLFDDQQIRDEFDPNAAEAHIRTANPALPETTEISFMDLHTWAANRQLGFIMGVSDAELVNDTDSVSSYGPDFRPVCDTDGPEIYDPYGKHPFLCGYNSTNYDTVVLALYLELAFEQVAGSAQAELPESNNYLPTTAAAIRSHSDQLFTEEHIQFMPRYLTTLEKGWNSTPNRLRQSMLLSGRHIDVARFNETQQKVALKRLLGGLGRQIKESDKLSGPGARIDDTADAYELLAYNVSDVVGLKHLFRHPMYSSAFDLKMRLMQTYPETVYEKSADSVKPDIRSSRVRSRPMRLRPDSSSAQFAATTLAPYAPLQDMETVSLNYPSEQVAREQNVTRRNILDQARDFFFDRVSNESAREQFMEVYHYYRSIEGVNFNDTIPGADPDNARMLRDIPKRPLTIPYFTEAGEPTSCFANFSYGGIHGAEAHTALHAADAAESRFQQQMIDRAKQLYLDPLDFRAEAKRQHELLRLPDGTVVSKPLVIHGSKWRLPKKDDPEQNSQLEAAKQQLDSAEDAAALQRDKSQELDVITDDGEILTGKLVLDRTTLSGATYRSAPAKAEPKLFKYSENETERSNRLDPRYTYTSSGMAIHEDFTSYYPNLLMNLSAFANPELGLDRYQLMFEDKERYGAEIKKLKSQTGEGAGQRAAEIERLTVLRNGTKLILNAASGAGDAGHRNNIKMNNTIIAMRLIGQLFSWMIAQAQTFAGGKVISTNTDGLYVSGINEHFTRETSDAVLAEEAHNIGIEIEPEPMLVVSKDSNNRLEIDVPDETTPIWEAEVLGASGGTLTSWEAPRVDKSIAHAAALDRALVQYLRLILAEANPPWRREKGLGPLSLEEPMDIATAESLMHDIRDKEDPVTAARLFQVIVAASSSVLSFPFLADPMDDEKAEPTNPVTLQHYSRIFIVAKGTEGAGSLHSAGAWKVNPTSALRRAQEKKSRVKIDGLTMDVLAQLGFARTALEASQNGTVALPADQDIARRKVPGIEPTWDVIVENQDLVTMDPSRLSKLLESLDMSIYAQWAADRFNATWHNTPVES